MHPTVALASVLLLAASAAAAVGGPSPSAADSSEVQARNAGSEPFLGSYNIEDSCMYKLCGPDHTAEFGGGRQPQPGSCSGDCDSLAHREEGIHRGGGELLFIENIFFLQLDL